MSLAAIRAKLAAQDNKAQGNREKSQGDNQLYPFWNIKEGEQATVRFLPDGDSSNSFFWVEKAMFKLPFTGVKGQNDSKEYTVQIPCMEMYGENCPILAEVRTWYKDDSLKEMANKYWKKRTYLFQGFVKQSPLADDTTPENPIRRFVITPQIFAVIKASLMDPEIEEMPTDTLRGLDFKIVKTQKGGYADYSTSGWARKESALTAEEEAAIAQHGLFNLKEFLPKKPSEAEQRIMKEMFEASVDGRPYDAERWGAYFKPWGLDVGTAPRAPEPDANHEPIPKIPASAPASAPVAEAAKPETQPWEADAAEAAESIKVPAPAAGSDKATDILAMIRARQGKTA
jgi:hypothetical protein